MRILWYSNDPRMPTGYGEQTAQVIRRMAADGHAIVVQSNSGTVRFLTEWEGIPVYPTGLTQHSTDLIGGSYVKHQADVLFTLYDVWVLPDIEFPTFCWTPIDHDPVPPEVAEQAKRPTVQTIAMARFGQEALAREGISSIYIPHAIERVFQPTPSDWRARTMIPDDAFVVGINAANRDHKDRKGFWPMFDALGRFQKAHPDVWVYLHTWAGKDMGGLDLAWWSLDRGMAVDRVRKVPPIKYIHGDITKTDMAEMYSACDVLLSTSKGEGFGIPVIEAMACGTPAIVTDATAQPELVGDTGWKIRWEPEPDFYMGTSWARPDPDATLEALEEAYAERGTPAAAARSQAAIAKAAEYDADTVYDQHWRPLLASIEAELTAPKPNREQRRSQKRGKAA